MPLDHRQHGYDEPLQEAVGRDGEEEDGERRPEAHRADQRGLMPPRADVGLLAAPRASDLECYLILLVSGWAAAPVQAGMASRRGDTMEYAHLGRTGLQVSRLVLGTMNFGPETAEEDSFAIMDRAHEHGINFFDTANVYGWVRGEGVTEQIIGRWIAQGGGRREKTVLATKLYNPMGTWPNEGRISALHIRRACDESLRRLQTDHIDLYQLHHVDREAPWDEVWEAMDVLRHQGKIIYVGSSNFAGWHLVQAQEAARRLGMLGLVSRAVPLQLVPA